MSVYVEFEVLALNIMPAGLASLPDKPVLKSGLLFVVALKAPQGTLTTDAEFDDAIK